MGTLFLWTLGNPYNLPGRPPVEYKLRYRDSLRILDLNNLRRILLWVTSFLDELSVSTLTNLEELSKITSN
jgi:hypothetical protein